MKKNIFADISTDILKKRKKEKQPTFIEPMLATLTKDYFTKKDWVYEHKFDGVRCLAFKKNGKVQLLSRNDNSMNNTYPEIVKALQDQEADNFIIDGEIIAQEKGVSNFQMLQERINLQDFATIEKLQKKVPVIFCIFDLVYADGYNLQHLPLYARKEILEKLLDYNKILLYTKHKTGDTIRAFKKACQLKWEGLIVKDINSSYYNKRSKSWLKFKCSQGQELVIGGYTQPLGERSNFGALLVGYYQDGQLQYAGKVGTGFTFLTLMELGTKLQKLEIKNCPFVNFDGNSNLVHWVKPILVGEFEFAEWTKSGKLRVGRFKGLRIDKKATLVVKEVPK
ncbi:MAG: non-homologous end-joining DNA ligase [Candidatus Babeliales bacterium]|nr:non-homologous end-joining DNA ligase [Candidatus Babeliales bacterium]